MPDEWLTTSEAAEITGYHIVTIRKLLLAGKLEGKKWGQAWMVGRRSLDDYLAGVKAKGAKRGPKAN